ncbi:MAG: peptidyl-prolyl cis-trans isomerase A (cyclophilin A), partial [Kiritimatiellia bacterium]
SLRAGSFDEAEQVLGEVVDHPSAQVGLALVRLMNHRDDMSRARRAVESLASLHEQYPDDGCLLQTSALSALVSQRADEARTWSEQAYAINPDQVDVALTRAVVLLMDDPDKAQETLEKALIIHPQNPAVNFGLGMVFMAGGDLDSAAPRLKIAQEHGADVGEDLLRAYRMMEDRAGYIQQASHMGMPMGDKGAIKNAEDPEAAYRQVVGYSEGQELVATFDTSKGEIVCVLDPKLAPVTVANFVGLARGTQTWSDPRIGELGRGPLYNNTVFHRVIPSFMVQGGDPLGTGAGGPGYRFVDEAHPSRSFDRPGVLAMANSGPNTNGSQFFVTEVPTPHLNMKHTIFGECTAQSVEIVKTIARTSADDAQVLLRTVRIEARAVSAEP